MKVKVYGLEITVVHEELEDTHGHYEKDKLKITLDKSLEGDLFYETLLHEIFHAVEYRISINQAVNSEVMEIINDTFAKAIVENFDIRLKGERESLP